jgi:hypothetical protein
MITSISAIFPRNVLCADRVAQTLLQLLTLSVTAVSASPICIVTWRLLACGANYAH